MSDTVDSMHLPPEMCDRAFTMNRQYFLDYILKDSEGRQVFMTFLKQRHCAENIMFWVDAVRFFPFPDSTDAGRYLDLFNYRNVTLLSTTASPRREKKQHFQFSKSLSAVILRMRST
jgi:hypothetical protein